MATRDDVRVRIGGDNRGLAKALKESNRIVSRFSRTGTSAMTSFTSGVASTISSVFSLRGAVATLAGTGGFGLLIKNSIASADQLAKTADKIGLGVEALQEYRFAARSAGVSTTTFDMAMQRFSRRFGEAVQGTGELKDTLKQYGIAVRNADGSTRKIESVFGDYAEAIRNAESDQERLRLAFKAFDSEGAAVVNMLRRGRSALDDSRKAAREAGAVIDSNLVRAAERAQNELGKTSDAAAAAAANIGLKLAPAVSRAASAFREALPAINSFFAGFGEVEVLSDKALQDRIKSLREIVELSEGSIVGRARRALGDTSQTDAQRELAAALAEVARRQQEKNRREAEGNSIAVETLNALKSKKTTIADVRSELQFELDQLGRSHTEQRLYNEARKAGLEVNGRFRQELDGLVAAINAETMAMEVSKLKSEETAAELKRLEEAGQRVFRDTRTDAEQFALEMERLNELADRGAITWDTYQRAVKQAQEELGKTNDLAKETDKLFGNVSVTLSSGFADAILEGKRLSNVFQALTEDVAKLVIQTLLLRAVQSGISALGGLFSGGGGGITASQAGAIGSVAPATTAGIGFEKGGAWDKGARFLARGGVLNSPTAFMDNNGPAVAGEAGPEAVLPLKRGKGGMLGVVAEQQSAHVQVNVYAPPNTETRTSQSSDSRGGKTIDVLIDEAVSNAVSTPGTRTNRALLQSFGLTSATIRR